MLFKTPVRAGEMQCEREESGRCAAHDLEVRKEMQETKHAWKKKTGRGKKVK